MLEQIDNVSFVHSRQAANDKKLYGCAFTVLIDIVSPRPGAESQMPTAECRFGAAEIKEYIYRTAEKR